MNQYQQASSDICMDDKSITELRKQTTEEVLPKAHGAAVVSSNLKGTNPLEWTVTVKIFETISAITKRENFIDGNETHH